MFSKYNFASYKDREVTPGRYKIYWNLHQLRWSLVPLEGPYKGLVVGHADELGLSDVEFTVSEPGRQRAIQERKKNVHAYAIGRLRPTREIYQMMQSPLRPISYNPFRGPHFMAERRGEKSPIRYADAVVFSPRGNAYATGE